ncbi:MAG: type I restriction endonuclease subunit R, partial [Candidatus Accumulibacter sp.]|nr:type I restriction endonuclease subunit R [Accumulibacter sp.]
PIEFEDKSTPAVFGGYVDTYTIAQAVTDEATKPIHYEARQAMLDLPDDKLPVVDEEFEDVTEGEEEASKHRLKSRWAGLEAMVGTEERIGKVAADLVDHWERRLEAMDGKAMVVAMSRRIAVELYEAIRKLRPDWHSDDEGAGVMKVIMTGSASDPAHFQPHVRSKVKLKAIERRFKDPADPLKIV